MLTREQAVVQPKVGDSENVVLLSISSPPASRRCSVRLALNFDACARNASRSVFKIATSASGAVILLTDFRSAIGALAAAKMAPTRWAVAIWHCLPSCRMIGGSHPQRSRHGALCINLRQAARLALKRRCNRVGRGLKACQEAKPVCRYL